MATSSEKRELFCRALADGEAPVDAAVSAGYTLATAAVRGPQMARNPDVVSRVAALKGTTATRARTAIEKKAGLPKKQRGGSKAELQLTPADVLPRNPATFIAEVMAGRIICSDLQFRADTT